MISVCRIIMIVVGDWRKCPDRFLYTQRFTLLEELMILFRAVRGVSQKKSTIRRRN